MFLKSATIFLLAFDYICSQRARWFTKPKAIAIFTSRKPKKKTAFRQGISALGRENYLDDDKIAYRPYHAPGVYFDDPNQRKPEGHRSYQGAVIEKELDIAPPYFIYKW